MTEIELRPLKATNPGALFAALGALDVAHRLLPDRRVTLRWTDSFVPRALITGPDSMQHLIELILLDSTQWANAVSLSGPGTVDADDLKPHPDEVREWFVAASRNNAADLRLLYSLISEGAVAGQPGDKVRLTKPTHLHFTAGQQRFLVMVRELRENLTQEHLTEALVGPWKYESELPVMGWDAKGERMYALRATSPSGDKKTGVPGADWLGFLGLRFFPVTTTLNQSLETAGCSGSWKSGSFTWPVWTVPLTEREIVSMFSEDHRSLSKKQRELRGLTEVFSAPIRRTDQGGYGSFGPASPVTPSQAK